MLSATGAAATWNKEPEFGPHWYPLTLTALALPTAWIGSKSGERQLAAKPGRSVAIIAAITLSDLWYDETTGPK